MKAAITESSWSFTVVTHAIASLGLRVHSSSSAVGLSSGGVASGRVWTPSTAGGERAVRSAAIARDSAATEQASKKAVHSEMTAASVSAAGAPSLGMPGRTESSWMLSVASPSMPTSLCRSASMHAPLHSSVSTLSSLCASESPGPISAPSLAAAASTSPLGTGSPLASLFDGSASAGSTPLGSWDPLSSVQCSGTPGPYITSRASPCTWSSAASAAWPAVCSTALSCCTSESRISGPASLVSARSASTCSVSSRMRVSPYSRTARRDTGMHRSRYSASLSSSWTERPKSAAGRATGTPELRAS